MVWVDPETDNISIDSGSLPRTYSCLLTVVRLAVVEGKRVSSVCRGVAEELVRRIAVKTVQKWRCMLGEHWIVAALKIFKCIERNL